MNFRKVLAIVVCLILLFCLVGCDAAPQETPSTPEGTENNTRNYMTLLYSSSDSFNPYTGTTDVNRQLCRLIYEPLVKNDNEFEPVLSLAATVTRDGTVCRVTLRDALFSDGSSLTAEDVVYSFNLAKGTAGVFASNLSFFASATAENTKTVVFNLIKADPYFANLLDFPILKAGSDLITDSDSVRQPPIGCGRYKVNETKDGLVINQHYFGEVSSITEIKLINAPDMESVSHYVEIGAADMYYSDISDGKILRMSGKKLSINLNNLIYIGFNRNNATLDLKELRHAISSGIDRKSLCSDVFYNNALPANGFFNPVWKETQSLQNIQIERNSQITIENLEKIGYNRLNANSNALKFTLLVNSENRVKVAAAKLISEQLLEYGIKITVIEKNYADYLESLANGNFQLYLGEVRIPQNMDLGCLVANGGSAAYGLKLFEADGSPTVNGPGNVVAGFYGGNNTVSDVATLLQTEMPLVPVCYRTGVLFCDENIENISVASADDIYFSIGSYIYNE